MAWFSSKTLESIVADLQKKIDDLKTHAEEKLAEEAEHLEQVAEHSTAATLARGVADKAKTIASNIEKLLGA